VSVPRVCLIYPMYSDKCTAPLRTVGSPIRKSLYPSTYDSTRLIGVSPVLLRLLVPRHPPCALIHLTYERFKTFKTLFDVVGLLLFSFQGTKLPQKCIIL